MARVKKNKPRRQRPAEGVVSNDPFTREPERMMFDSSDPRIETFRKVQAQLHRGEEPDPADVQLLWDWHQEDQITG